MSAARAKAGSTRSRIDLSNGGIPRLSLSYPLRKVMGYLREHRDVRHTPAGLIRANGHDPECGDTMASMIWTCCRLAELSKVKAAYTAGDRYSVYWYESPKEAAV